MTELIQGGYYIKPRKIDSSDIRSKQPAIRETWDFLIREASFQDGFKKGRYLRRGQLFLNSYQDIRDALCWYAGSSRRTYSESTVKRAMKYLRETGRITTTNVPNGVVITICKYNYFQDIENYERTLERTPERMANEPRTYPERTVDPCKLNNDDCLDESQKKEKKEKNIYMSKTPPFDEITEAFHEILPELPGIRAMSDARKAALKARWNSGIINGNGTPINSIEYWTALFHYIRESGHLMGNNNRSWKANIDFITKESSFLKIIEGAYH